MSEGRAPQDAKVKVKPPVQPDLPPTLASDGWAVLSTLIAGIAVWAGVGYGLDRLFDTEFLLPVGMLLGVASAIYLVVVKYGRPPQ
jgi:hypothetical protein